LSPDQPVEKEKGKGKGKGKGKEAIHVICDFTFQLTHDFPEDYISYLSMTVFN